MTLILKTQDSLTFLNITSEYARIKSIRSPRLFKVDLASGGNGPEAQFPQLHQQGR